MSKAFDISLSLARATRKTLSAVKQKLRQKVPNLKYAEIRRIRLPLHEALLLELKESFHENAYKFFNELIQDNEEALTKDNKLLELIFNELKKAEYATKQDEINILLKLGKSFESDIRGVSDMIYLRVLVMVKNYNLEDTLIDASAQYYYGKFLSDHTEKLQEAVSYLTTSLEISEGVKDWFVEDASLSVLAAIELCKALIKLSNHVRGQNPRRALELAKKSLKIIRQNKSESNIQVEIDSQISIGTSFIELKEFDKARLQFEFAFELAKFGEYHESGLEALMKLSECYQNLKNADKFEGTLNRAADFARINALLASEGDILETLGQFWVDHDNSTKALMYWQQCVESFRKSEQTEKMRRIQILVAKLLGKLH